MDTKWKKCNGSVWYKLFLLLIIHVAIGVSCWCGVEVIQNNINVFEQPEGIENDFSSFADFRESHDLILNYILGEERFVTKTSIDEILKFSEYYIEKTDGEILTNNKALNSLNVSDMELYVVLKDCSSGTFEDYDDLTIETDWFLSRAYINRYHRYDEQEEKTIRSNILANYNLKKFIFRYNPDYAVNLRVEYERKYAESASMMNYMAVSVLLSFIGLILLTISAGRKSEDEEVHTRWLERIKMEFLVLIVGSLFIVVWITLFNVSKAIGHIYYDQPDANIVFYLYLAVGALMMVLADLGLALYLSIVRRIKARIFGKSFFVVDVVVFLFNIIKKAFIAANPFVLLDRNKAPMTKRLMTANVLYIVLSVWHVFILFVGAMDHAEGVILLAVFLETLFTALFIIYTRNIHKRIEENISERVKKMVQAERTKTELITGVSHDLKTPITSIVAYIDLLKKEELDAQSREYVEILDQKAGGLSTMVKDLFEIAKTASGEITVDKGMIDVNKLVKQTLADMKERIEKSDFVIKETYDAEEMDVMTDGSKLYRVLQNLVDNALKYSLKGSRIYLDTKKQGNGVRITVKNTASYEMDFEAEDMKKRFSRADESRTEDGSGLGLAIVSTFVSAMGGTFDIVIDGDQFNAIVEL